MQTQASQQHNQLVRIGGIAVVMSCAAVIATLLTRGGIVRDAVPPSKRRCACMRNGSSTYCRQAPYNWFNFYDFWSGASH